MAVPTYDLMMRPLLELAAQQDITWRTAEQAMRTHFHVTEEEMALLTPTGQIGLVRNRAGWAMTCLKKAGLLANVAPITYRATDAGVAYLEAHRGDITSRDLLAIDAYRQFVLREASGNPSTPPSTDVTTSTLAPAEASGSVIQIADADVRQPFADVAMLSPQQMKAYRESLGLTETEVADALLFSVAQVRGVESGSPRPFYNEGFYNRARAKYITLLKTPPTRAKMLPVPAVSNGA
jgi:restriction endonuclease Mrr